MSEIRGCADCGSSVERGRNGHWRDAGGSFVCRCEVDYHGPKLLWADYHYVMGEDQRHFRAP